MAAIPPIRLSATTPDDPFLSPIPGHQPPHRYASFDNSQLHSLYNSTSPSQAKRALEAHLKDTDRRIQDASRLGQTLLKQRKDVADRLKDIENEKDENEIGPELQEKLSNLEKEYTEVGRESARTFLPKNRISSQESVGPGSPSVFAADSRSSPSKVSAPSRRQRNQPVNRVHDIEFATEISTSLLAQVRQLQAVLAEKDDTLRNTTAEKAQLEMDIANLVHRLKVLDESEQKYKEENWNLETQLQEMQASLKDLTDKENRLNQLLKSTQAEKDAAQRELEDLKHGHGKLVEDYELSRKHNDSEIHGLRRDVAHHETLKNTLQKKIEELTSQNTELARAVAARWHDNQDSANRDSKDANDNDMDDGAAPEHSPPPSPSKTPARNGMLETETLKSSLTHAHRMIQNLKNNIHREKTEKVELKRMLQDARDEIESHRNGSNPLVSKRRRSAQENAKKQIKIDRLGASRTSTREIIMDDDEDWEDQESISPSRVAPAAVAAASAAVAAAAASKTGRRGPSSGRSTVNTDADSTDAFETANERESTTTESEAFETGVETIDGNSSDDLTETEGTIRVNQPTSSRPSIIPGDRRSYQSTASTDDDQDFDVSTPVQQQHPKLRLKNVRSRRSGRASGLFSPESIVGNESPNSIHSSERGTPRGQAGQSLMAELEGLSDDDEEEESEAPTPSRNNSIVSSPEAHKQRVVSASTALGDALGESALVQSNKPQMVDSDMMTEPWEPEPKSMVSAAAGAVGGAIAGVAGYALGKSTSNDKDQVSHESSEKGIPDEHVEQKILSTEDMGLPRREAIQRANMGTPRVPLQKISGVVSQQTQPVLPQPAAPQSQLAYAITTTTETEPLSPAPPTVPQPAPLAFAPTTSTATEPVAPSLPAVSLAIATATLAETEPILPARETVREIAPLGVATTTTAETEPISPVHEVVREVAPFAVATATAAQTEPISPTLPAVAPLDFATTTVTHTEPIPQQRSVRVVEPLAVSSMVIADTEPKEPVVRQTSNIVEPFGMSAIMSQGSEPVTPAESLRGAEFETLPRKMQRPNFYTDSGFSPERTREKKTAYASSFYKDSGFSPEKEWQEPAIPGTTYIRPGAAFFANNPTVPPPASQFPPRTSSIRSISPERIYTSKGVDVYADENSSASQIGRPGTSNSRTPFSEVSNNVNSSQRSVVGDELKPELKTFHTSESGTQTMVSSEEIDSMMRNKDRGTGIAGFDFSQPDLSPSKAFDTSSFGDTGLKPPRRPASSGSNRKNNASAPPLPSDHSLKIAAVSNNMGPPTMSAAAYKSLNGIPSRSNTPSIRSQSIRNGNASIQRPRLSNAGSNRPTLEIPSPLSRTQTRRSSVTSFASELDERFHINRSNIYPEDMPPTTDPRMIQAITQTMIGEHLWKYTRKAGRSSEISNTRHRRFFWVHPYTRTLYWSETDPSTHGAKQSKAKSVAIEAVRVISDNNTYPPGLHTKSLVVVTPGREIVFTAPTSSRHETWFNALSYLLMRTGAEREGDINDTLEEFTRDDVDEFNPQVPGRRASRTSGRTGVTMSTYNSRATRGTNSPMRRDYITEVPTLGRRGIQRKTLPSRRSHSVTTPESRRENYGSISSRFGTLFRTPGNNGGSFSSTKRSTSALSNRPAESTMYDASVIEEDSEDDLRAAVERGRKERDEAGLMENVRACCDGKHDVASLSRPNKHSYSHTNLAGGPRSESAMSKRTQNSQAHPPSEHATAPSFQSKGGE